MTIDYGALSLTDLIKLQDEIERETQARYGKKLTLVFTDVAGSTAYFERHGDTAGRALLQRHLDQLREIIELHQGRIVDTAGDGAFCTFPKLLPAVLAMSKLQAQISQDNSRRSAEHCLGVRIGLHLGEVLTDGVIVTGDAVHLAARVSSTADAGEIHLTQSTLEQLPPSFRVRCRPLPPAQLKGFAEQVPLAALEWRDTRLFPSKMVVQELGLELDLPSMDVVRFGRLAEHEGKSANEVVLAHPDPQAMRRISRWHFELHRRPRGLFLRAVSRAQTEVDGRPIALGEEVQVRPGSTIRVGWVLNIRLLSPGLSGGDETIII